MKGATACIIGFLTWSQVSIHAPMKGATHRGRNPGIGLGVSIHAPMKGATTKVLDRWIFLHCFNPRSHEGSDLFYFIMRRRYIRFQSTLP